MHLIKSLKIFLCKYLTIYTTKWTSPTYNPVRPIQVQNGFCSIVRNLRYIYGGYIGIPHVTTSLLQLA